MPRREPNLKILCMAWSAVMPNGYRLVTVEEVRNHFDAIARLGVPPLYPDESIIEGEKMHLLDGYMTYPSHGNFELQQTFEKGIRLMVVAKEKEWDADAGIWRARSSACYSSYRLSLRTNLYRHLPLSQDARQTALLYACSFFNMEVLYWLLTTATSSEELERFQLSFNAHFSPRDTSIYPYMRRIVGCLFQLALKLNSPKLNELLSECDKFEFHESSHHYHEIMLRVVELRVELFSVEITDLEDSFDMFSSNIAENTHPVYYYILTKLLLSQRMSGRILEDLCLGFDRVFLEAFERGYAPLLKELFDFKHKDVDVSLLIRVLNEAVKVGVERGMKAVASRGPLVKKLLEFTDYEQITRDEFVEFFEKEVSKGHPECVQKLLELVVSKVQGKLLMEVDTHGKTLIHYAGESGDGHVFHLLVEKLLCNVQSQGSNLQEGTEESQNIVRNRDKSGRSILHWASLLGQDRICKICIHDWKLKVETKDSSGQNSLHFAGKGILGHQVVDLLIDSSSRELLHSTDYKGRTPLHLAAAIGNKQMVKRLLRLAPDRHSKLRYIRESDSFGRTALHMAVRGGHEHLVQVLLKKGSEPLRERDMHGQTSLHYATQVEDPYVAVALSRRLLDNQDSENKSLLMWSSAAGIGTAEENERTRPYVRAFLKEKKECDETHLLKAAAVKNNVQMAWELVNRGANLSDLHDDDWRKRLSFGHKENVENVINQIALANKRGHDKPSLEDKLGRSTFAEGLAALFLNKFIESPITVGISGDWGMGKSSLMIQTEQILLMAASQLTFPNLLMFEKFKGAEEMSLNNKGVHIYQNFKGGVGKLLGQEKYSSQTENPLLYLLKSYQLKYHEIYKSIACMDQNGMLKPKTNQSVIQSQSQVWRGVPRILTVQYNAWHYRNEQEAWAGLAVRISEEIEKSMTRAQRFSTCWKYTWNLHRMTICLQVFIPFFFATLIAGWVAWGAWMLLSKGKLKKLTLGSVPFTVVAIAWGVLKSVISVVKPVSEQMMGYISSPDHSSSLGYQQKVISDINFLKKEIGRKPGWFFSFISGERCRYWFGLFPDNIENTCIPKFQPASEDHLRIITFVDDLDRCEEKVILQVLSAINLVLAECQINVILGMDKKMIERAIKRNFGDNDDQDLADRFICKIIQIPLSLPEPTEEELNIFLENQLGQPLKSITTALDGGETDYGEIESDVEEEKETESDVEEENAIETGEQSNGENTFETGEQSNGNHNTTPFAVVDIRCSSGTQTRCQGIIKLLRSWLGYLYLFVCNILRKFWYFGYESNHEKIRPLTLSKGARISREMLLSNYSREEVNIFSELKSFATDNQKLPREWKRLLNYHKLACNILSRQGKVYSLPGWNEQLVAWVFVCWQWKHEMNILFKDWHKYAVVSSIKATEDEVENLERWHGPSLKTIVINYIKEMDNSLDSANNHVVGNQDNQSNGPMEKGLMKLKDCLRQDPFIKTILALYRYDTTSVKEDESYYRNWLNLHAALVKQDVSMKGIQLFQQFRLHCETCHLPWPLLQSNQRASLSKILEA